MDRLIEKEEKEALAAAASAELIKEKQEEEEKHVKHSKRTKTTDEDGIITVEAEEYDEELGQNVLITTTFKVIKKRVPKVVAERKKWSKFGASVRDKEGPNIATTYVAEPVKIDFAPTHGHEAEKVESAVYLHAGPKKVSFFWDKYNCWGLNLLNI